jgi:hypothetical protein
MMESELSDSRTGKNTQHGLLILLRQSVYSIDSAGLPRNVVFEFSVPLESPSIVWLEMLGKELSPWSPPTVCQKMRLSCSRDFFRVAEQEK